MSFITPVDIANRALQHLGATRIDPTLGFAENSKNAAESAFCYDKLRKSELERNAWTFSIRTAVLRALTPTTMLLQPTLWSASTTYFFGHIVADETNQLWISRIPNNLNYIPQDSSNWEQYFGPLSVSLWDTSGKTAYRTGELVYTTAGLGAYRVYESMVDNNADNPATPTAWDATVVYRKNQVITRTAVAYMSLIDFNMNNDPALSPIPWSALTTYAGAQQAAGSDGVIYTSLSGGNLNHDPIVSPGFWTNTGVLVPWTSTFVGGRGSIKWLQVGGAEFPFGVALSTINIPYPVGSGPTGQSSIKNSFYQPSGFLAKAPQDAKAGSVSYLGYAWNVLYSDWEFENNFITSCATDPLFIRFVTDIVDVSRMSSMFCEGLGARMAEEMCEQLTQSSAKLANVTAAYKTVMGEARLRNAILVGSEEPPLDDYVACRA